MGPQQSHISDTTLQSPQAHYIVLRVGDITASAEFFTVLGFNPVREKHGDGPEHFSFCIHGNLVCELYPWNKDTSPPVNFARFGLQVPSLHDVRVRLSEAKIPITRESATDAQRQWVLVLDPDGNQIELFEQAETRS